LIDLLVRYRLDSAGGLAGDDLLAALQVAGFAVRRYGFNAALDDALGGALHRVPEAYLLYAFADKQAEYSLALRALRAPDRAEGKVHALRCVQTAAIGVGADETDSRQSAVMRARELLGRLRVLGFRANLDGGGLYIADTTGWRRDLSKFISPALVFEVLNAGIDDDPGLVADVVSSTSEKRRIACEGRDRFVAEGWAEKALAHGWSKRELFAPPERCSRVDQCGVGWLIGERRVIAATADAIAATADAIAVETKSGARLRFHRRAP
jgi:hypothetical protein